MKAEDIRELSDEEIWAQQDEAREELMNLRFQQSTGELIDTSRLAQTRKIIARCQTVLNERKREAVTEGES